MPQLRVNCRFRHDEWMRDAPQWQNLQFETFFPGPLVQALASYAVELKRLMTNGPFETIRVRLPVDTVTMT